MTVLKGAQIGDGAVIGAKAVVWGGNPIPENAVVVGIPAVVTKYRKWRAGDTVESKNRRNFVLYFNDF